MAVLCAASVGKALCGVVAGGAKASLSAHFAVKGDVGELSAVDAGQETVIGLAGMLVRVFSSLFFFSGYLTFFRIWSWHTFLCLGFGFDRSLARRVAKLRLLWLSF